MPVLGPLFGALLVLLLLAIPSPPQHQIIGLLEEVLWLRQMPPDGYCEAMGAKQDAREAAAGGSTQNIGRRRLGEAGAETEVGGAAAAAARLRDAVRGQFPPPPPPWGLDMGAADWASAQRVQKECTRLAVCGEAAEQLVALFSRDDKLRLVQGVGWRGWVKQPGFYVGNILGVPRLGVPSINMQDAAQGFRTIDPRMVGQVTSWPCALALAASWDPGLARKWGQALGQEFRAKGANVILGPSVNVHRVARNGRNAEYLSGEDGALGAPLADGYVRGVQGEGVAAVVKHFVLNSQETHRSAQSSDASDRTLWEVYYPPFEAAVRAGVASVMCGYNRINGTYACGNAHVLRRHLKLQMGFEGWVMSDWWATHSTHAAASGVDQNMPGSDRYFDAYSLGRLEERRAPRAAAVGFSDQGISAAAEKAREAEAEAAAAAAAAATAAEKAAATAAAEKAAEVEAYDLDDMARRIVGGMLGAGAWAAPLCTAGCDCHESLYAVNASRASHTDLARQIATESVVLLQNDGGHLPLTPGLTVALLGSACSATNAVDQNDWTAGNYYTVGGSGRVIGPYAVSVRAGLEARGVTLIVEERDDIDAAKRAMRDADVVIACGGATSTESRDRPSLKLDQHDFLVALSKSMLTHPLIILAMAPGAVLTDWAREDTNGEGAQGAQAVAAMFLGGQESGHAWAAVLMGDVSPSGKLPVTFPLREEDTIPPCEADHCVYTEGLHVGWRGLHGKDVAYPFGHGLSYTTFALSWLQPPAALYTAPPAAGRTGGGQMVRSKGEGASNDCAWPQSCLELRVAVTNSGTVHSGAEVLQLYLSYPEAAGEPPLVLRAYSKTAVLAPGESAEVRFSISRRELSIWSEEIVPAAAAGLRGGWQLVTGGFTAHVGTSSRDENMLRADFTVQ